MTMGQRPAATPTATAATCSTTTSGPASPSSPTPLNQGPGNGRYHRLDFGDGLVDRRHLRHRQAPAPVPPARRPPGRHRARRRARHRVLRVGLYAARGAEVTAIDIWEELPIVDDLGAEGRHQLPLPERESLHARRGLRHRSTCHLRCPCSCTCPTPRRDPPAPPACAAAPPSSRRRATETAPFEPRPRCVFVGEQVPNTSTGPTGRSAQWPWPACARSPASPGSTTWSTSPCCPSPGRSPSREHPGVPHLVLTATV